jgi:cell division septal protein FtsQ
LAARTAAIRRVDGRRWDILLQDHAVILLPPSGEPDALSRLDRLDRASGALDLGLARIDLRNQHFTVLRPAAPAADARPAPTSGGE